FRSLIEYPSIEISFLQFLERFVAARQVVKQNGHGFLNVIHHFVRLPSELFVVGWVSNEVVEGVYVAGPIRPEYRVDRKALIAFIVSKHAVLEELIGLFGPIFIFIELI